MCLSGGSEVHGGDRRRLGRRRSLQHVFQLVLGLRVRLLPRPATSPRAVAGCGTDAAARGQNATRRRGLRLRQRQRRDRRQRQARVLLAGPLRPVAVGRLGQRRTSRRSTQEKEDRKALYRLVKRHAARADEGINAKNSSLKMRNRQCRQTALWPLNSFSVSDGKFALCRVIQKFRHTSRHGFPHLPVYCYLHRP